MKKRGGAGQIALGIIILVVVVGGVLFYFNLPEEGSSGFEDPTSVLCGNGGLDGNEQCDDGNTVGGDGCSSLCVLEGGFSCSGEPSECQALVNDECFDGQDNDGNGFVDFEDFGCFGPNGQETDTDYGFTLFEPSEDTRIVYVSSSEGDDNNTGLSPGQAKKTIDAGKELIRDQFPDWILLKRGDVWRDEGFGTWHARGRSFDEKVLLGSYGEFTQRPKLDFSGGRGFFTCQGCGPSPGNMSHIALVGIHFYNYQADPDHPEFSSRKRSCMQWLGNGGDFLFEDNKFEFCQVNLQSRPSISPMQARRNVYYGSYSVGSHAQNMFTNMGPVEFLIEENVFEKGGWNDDFRFVLYNPENDSERWKTITDGRFRYELNKSHYNIEGLDFSSVEDMNDVAQVLEEGINSAVGSKAMEIEWTQGQVFKFDSDVFPSDRSFRVHEYNGISSGFDIHTDAWLNESSQGVPESTIFNRNNYIAHGRGITTFRGNIDAWGASGGIQQREGGLNEDNLYLRNPHGVSFGHKQNDPNVIVSGIIRNNVVLGASDIDTQIQGSGILVGSVKETNKGGHSLAQNVSVYNNIVAHNLLGTGNFKGLSMQGDGEFTNVDYHDNIVYNWTRPHWPNPQDHRACGVRLNAVEGSEETYFRDNIIQQPDSGYVACTNNEGQGTIIRDNVYWSAEEDPPVIWSKGWFAIHNSASIEEWFNLTGDEGSEIREVEFADPQRDIRSYAASLGLEPSYEAFMAEAKMQSKFDWRQEYTAYAVNDYIREGFEIVG